MNANFRSLFLLDPAVHFLNHGSFGATPITVFDTYQSIQRELEEQPVSFLGREINDRMRNARRSLAGFLNCDPLDLIFFPNPTTAINMVVRNLNLSKNDEILSTNHEYGAMNRTWHRFCKETGAKLISQPISLPITDSNSFIEQVWSGKTDNTKILFLSHITSQTAQTFPIREICKKARESGILSIIDGAHAPGQIELDLEDIGADIYTGACHKWMCAPKGSAFLYVRKELQDQMDPLVVSWGYEAENPGDSKFIDYHEWQGTRDMSAFLSVPAAIQFMKEYDWPTIRQSCHALLTMAHQSILSITAQSSLYTDDQEFHQLAAVRLPDCDWKTLKARLYDDYKVEVPVYLWNDQPFLRISVQAYNTLGDVEALYEGLSNLIPELSH